MPGLGRILAPDDRDRNYSVARLLPQKIAPGIRYYPTGPILDQGETGTCVGHGCRARLNAAPIMVKPGIGAGPFDIYKIAIQLDEFTENDIEVGQPNDQLQFGTSVRAGMKALQQLGYINNYVWAFSVPEIINFLLSGQGTVVMGTNWKSGMWDTDGEGVLHVTGRTVGGHCWDITGVNTNREMVRCQNSWGLGWGDRGRFWLSFKDLEILMNEDGEACIPTEVRLPKPSSGGVQ